MDVGDVLVHTVPMAHYRALARYTGTPWERVAEIIEGTHIVSSFETGHMTPADFTDAVRALLSRPALRDQDVRRAWNAVVSDVDPVMTRVACRFAAPGRVLLASNTNPFHWQAVSARLAAAGVVAPACLSFEIGCAKPGRDFFAALAASYPQATRAVYIDDRADNVTAAVRYGLTGLLHRDPADTAGRLSDLLT